MERSSDHQVSTPRNPFVASATACVAASKRWNSSSYVPGLKMNEMENT